LEALQVSESRVMRVGEMDKTLLSGALAKGNTGKTLAPLFFLFPFSLWWWYCQRLPIFLSLATEDKGRPKR
jgi:hypothetical protein